MKIIISPAKKMKEDLDSLPWRELPCFLEKTSVLLKELKSLTPLSLKKLWKCSDSILEQNINRLETMHLTKNLTPALLSYEGIQYQYMAPGVFTETQLEYIQNTLRIISGFYGLLKPFDGVRPYRLEMQAKLKTYDGGDLYKFWKDTIYSRLAEEINGDEEKAIINLASKEYSKAVSAYLQPGDRFITCSFAEESEGKLTEKGTLCKIARGEMVRFMAENAVTNVNDIKAFDRLGYRYCKDCSSENSYVFVKPKENKLK